MRMPLTEVGDNQLIPPAYSNTYIILPEASLSLANNIPPSYSILFLSVVLSLHPFIFSVVSLSPLIPSTVAWCTLLMNFSSPIISICLKHFKRSFLFFPVHLAHSRTSLSLKSFLICPLFICYICFFNSLSQILLFFFSPLSLYFSTNHTDI